MVNVTQSVGQGTPAFKLFLQVSRCSQALIIRMDDRKAPRGNCFLQQAGLIQEEIDDADGRLEYTPVTQFRPT